MKNVRRLNGRALLLLFALLSARGATAEGYSSAPFADGEVLRYKVRWGPIRLATLTIRQERVGGGSGDWYDVRMWGATSPRLRILDLAFTNRAVLLSDRPTAHDFTFETGRSAISRIRYRYDEQANELEIIRCDTSGTVTTRLPHEGTLYDGGGIVMLIRGLSGSNTNCSVPTIVDQEIHLTGLAFTDQIKSTESDALGGTVRLRRVLGHADWVTQSVAGLSGAFEVWLTDGAEAIPVRASLKILIGSIVLDLESCARPGFMQALAAGGDLGSVLPEGGTP